MRTELKEEDLPVGTTPETIRALVVAYRNLLNTALPVYVVPDPPYSIIKELTPDFVFVPKPLTLEEQVKLLLPIFEQAVNARIQQECTDAGFDNITSACAYAATDNPLQAQSISFVNWRATIWLYCKEQLSKIQSGELPIPTIVDYLDSLPTRALPA